MDDDVTCPAHLIAVRNAALAAIAPVRPADAATRAAKDFLFTANRTDAGRDLPPYYVVYFLLVDLLGFKNLGQFEKVSWSVPIDYNGEAFLIEHSKFGLGIFARDPASQEPQAKEIADRIKAAVSAAEPFFDWLADRAVAESKLNVVNASDRLHERFEFFLAEYRRVSRDIVERDERRRAMTPAERLESGSSYFSEPFSLYQQREWLASSVVESFFSWTEHVFIHLAILRGHICTASEVAKLANDNWGAKFKQALDLSDPVSKKHYDDLVEIRRQHRNFVAHGSFGKRGEAFQFHSGAGAAPVLLPHRATSRRFSLTGPNTVEDSEAIRVILEFIEHLWSGPRAPARIYLQRNSLPIILTMAADGTYLRAMTSAKAMDELVDHLTGQWDRAANMDW